MCICTRRRVDTKEARKMQGGMYMCSCVCGETKQPLDEKEKDWACGVVRMCPQSVVLHTQDGPSSSSSLFSQLPSVDVL